MSRRKAKRKPLAAEPPPPPPAPDEKLGAGELLWRFVGMYLLLVLIGFIAFRHPATMVGGNQLQIDRALFASINAVTLSGFQQAVALDEYRIFGQVTALLLTIAGTLLALIGGGMAVARVARTGCPDRVIILAACAAEALVMLIGAVALRGRGRGVFDGIFQAASAFGHSGLHVGALPGVLEWRTHAILMPLSLLGGLGIPVLLTLAHALRRRMPLPPYVRLVLVLWAGSYVVGLIALTLPSIVDVWLDAPAAGITSDAWRDALATASVQSINSRTTGLPFPIGDGRPGQWVLMLLMAIGGVAGAAAGGIKMTTLAQLWHGTRLALRGAAPGAMFGIALVWVAGYLLLVLVPLLCLLATEPGQPAERLLFLAVSAASNVGLSHNPVSITGGGLFVLAGTMLLGRLAALAVLWWVVTVATAEEARAAAPRVDC